jgi:hypothetical protein
MSSTLPLAWMAFCCAAVKLTVILKVESRKQKAERKKIDVKKQESAWGPQALYGGDRT